MTMRPCSSAILILSILVIGSIAIAQPPSWADFADIGDGNGQSDRWDGYFGFTAPDSESWISDPAAGTEYDTLRGDSNCDGVIDFDDVDAFVAALIHESLWDVTRPGSSCSYLQANDVNRDGAVDFADVDAFIEVLVQSPG